MNGEVNGHPSAQHPSAKPINISPTIAIHPPLTRLGHGPGLVILVPDDIDLNGSRKSLDPPPLQKWAEEGFAVAQVSLAPGSSSDHLRDEFRAVVKVLLELQACDTVDRIGVISYNAGLATDVAQVLDKIDEVVAVINYGEQMISCSKPQLRHLTGPEHNKLPSTRSEVKSFNYPKAGPFFVIPNHKDFRSADAAVSHTRCLTFLKPLTRGPYFDIEAIWEEHTMYEFGERNVEKTMATMVQEPYVNHIPTMTGGLGRDRLATFYRHNFVFSNPDDTNLELISRTVGIDRVIDEFNFRFTHDRMMPWILPGIPPTGKYVEVPFTSVVNVRGDRLYHEHISWDGATLLRQLGLMPEYLPFPYPLPDGRNPADGKQIEFRVPTAGVETASKLRDESAIESNQMFSFEIREVDKK